MNKQDIDSSLEYYIRQGLIFEDEKIVKKLMNVLENEENHPWWDIFKDELTNFPEIQYLELPF